MVGRAYFSSDAVDTLMFSEFSIWFSLVINETVNNVDYYTQGESFVKN